MAKTCPTCNHEKRKAGAFCKAASNEELNAWTNEQARIRNTTRGTERRMADDLLQIGCTEILKRGI